MLKSLLDVRQLKTGLLVLTGLLFLHEITLAQTEQSPALQANPIVEVIPTPAPVPAAKETPSTLPSGQPPPKLSIPEPEPPVSENSSEDEEEELTWEQKFIRSNIFISKFFDRMAEKIDLYLAKGRLTNKRNETSIRIENSINVVDGDGLSNIVHLSVNLSLPNLEEYWNLKFTTYDEAEERRASRRGPLQRNERQRNLGATVGLFKKLKNVKASFQPRIELQDPLKVAHLVRFESEADLVKYQVYPKLEFFADPTKGTGVYSNLSVNFPIMPVYNFTIVNDVEYQESVNTFFSNSGLSFNHAFNELSSITYSVYFNSNNRPAYHLEGYSFSVAWSEILYKRILDYQLAPNLSFAREDRFKGTPGITLNLNLNF